MNIAVGAAWCIALAAILLGVTALATFRQPLLALRVMVDLFVAAGLLRLSVDLSWATIAGTVTVIAVRLLLTHSLTSDLIGARRRRADAG